MRKCIDIDERTYQQLVIYCNNNNIKLQEYLYNIIRNKIYIDIYGDLNDKIKKVKLKDEDKSTNILEKKIYDVDIDYENNEIILDKNLKIKCKSINIINCVQEKDKNSSKIEKVENNNIDLKKNKRIIESK